MTLRYNQRICDLTITNHATEVAGESGKIKFAKRTASYQIDGPRRPTHRAKCPDVLDSRERDMVKQANITSAIHASVTQSVGLDHHIRFSCSWRRTT